MPRSDEQRRWELVLPHSDRLVQLARRRLPDCSVVEAEDIAHEALLRAVKFEDLDHARVGQFLTAVTLRQCADVHRDRARQASAARRSWVEASNADIAEGVCDSMQAHWLMRQLSNLPEREAAVMRAAIDGEERATTAIRLGATLKALESAAGRARKSLRAAAALSSAFLALLLRRGTGARTSLGASLAAVTIFAVGATLGLHVNSPDRHRASQSPSRPAARSSTPMTGLGSRPQMRSHLRSEGSSTPTVAAPRGSERVLLATPEPHTPVGRLDSGANVTHSDDGRTFTESVEYCLAGHVTVSVSMIGCRG